jgi:hypothetical protein
MRQSEGLAKAAAMMAVVAALATLLAVNIAPPAAPNARHTREREIHSQRFPVPATTPRGGAGPDLVGAGAAQGQGAVARRREAGGDRASNLPGASPRQSGKVTRASGTRQ